ncbi:TfoX/Sxy family protein (plasmid) [Paroceanicella profunda]|uniref:TfoX/Sxy family protein n=1 Tax=Paroceanicella profunda TaxID=2579971 RepID=A0A5B8FYN6_9RHOB|nr:TfoX/Sxy family protein [Paroceanicella profunda]QDL94016.1 TfoX/Sxy family protein [Paroceanicella profunda]
MARAQPTEFVMHMLEALEPLGPITVTRLFGGWSMRLDGVQFGVVLGDTFYLCTDEAMRADLAAEGSVPFSYTRRKSGREVVIHRFYSLPEACLDDPDLALDWAQRAVDANRHRV